MALMQVFVEPANDNRPVFYPAQYTTTIPLGAPLGTYVLSVMARDPDLSVYGRVQYGIVAGSGSGVGYFTIDSSAGINGLMIIIDGIVIIVPLLEINFDSVDTVYVSNHYL